MFKTIVGLEVNLIKYPKVKYLKLTYWSYLIRNKRPLSIGNMLILISFAFLSESENAV